MLAKKTSMLLSAMALLGLVVTACNAVAAKAPATPTPVESPLEMPTPVPPTPTFTPVPPVTLADNGRAITLHIGQRFLLSLGGDYDWTVTVDHPLILSRVVNVTVVRGAQGLYEAHSPGYATLTAAGDPICRSAQPPCQTPSREFQIHIMVEQAAQATTTAVILTPAARAAQ